MCANAQRYKYTGERSCLFQIQEQSRVPKTKLQFFFKLHFLLLKLKMELSSYIDNSLQESR